MRPAKAQAQLRIKNICHMQTFYNLTLKQPVTTIVVYSPLLSLIFFYRNTLLWDIIYSWGLGNGNAMFAYITHNNLSKIEQRRL